MCINSDLSKSQALKVISTFFLCLLTIPTIRPAAKATVDPPQAMKVEPTVALPKEAQGLTNIRTVSQSALLPTFVSSSETSEDIEEAFI